MIWIHLNKHNIDYVNHNDLNGTEYNMYLDNFFFSTSHTLYFIGGLFLNL